MARRFFFPLVLCFFLLLPAAAQVGDPHSTHSRAPSAAVCARCIRAHLQYLASDAMRGRGSATPDELRAANYIARLLRRYGIKPAGDNGGYLQRLRLVKRTLLRPPRLRLSMTGRPPVPWTHGKEFIALRMAQAAVSGPLRKIDLAETDLPQEDAPSEAGAVVLLDAHGGNPKAAITEAVNAGAAAVLVSEYPDARKRWQEYASRIPKLRMLIAGISKEAQGPASTVAVVSADAVAALEEMADGTQVTLRAPERIEISNTRNVVGMIRGSDPALAHSAVLLSAHMDHLGVGAPVNGDSIYNGADDDASGTVAVLELARLLGARRQPRRTVIFALFGSEELGALGGTYFREHPPLPLKDIAANLEFEMIGRADPAVAPDTLWLTGWERSNLGPVLAEHGARLVSDPHPQQNFFARSDNYALAQKGVVAQTVSSYGLHGDYHQPSDDVAHIDFKHMDEAIGSLLGPIEWLVNSDFRPEWKPGGKP